MEIYVNPMKTASFDVDAQKGFTPLCPNELPVPEGDRIVPELNKNASKANWRVGSKDCHNPNGIWVATKENPQFSPVGKPHSDIRWNRHCEVGTKGGELLDGLPVEENYDFMVRKGVENHLHPYGAYYHTLVPVEKTGRHQSTGIIEFLKSWNVETVIVGGLATNFCVGTTAYQLKDAGFRVVVNLAACRGIDVTPTAVKEYVEKMKTDGIVVVENADEIVSLPWG